MLNVYSFGYYFMHLGILLEALRGKRILVISPNRMASHKQHSSLLALVRDFGVDYTLSVMRITLPRHDGQIRFEAWDEKHVWMRRGMADHELSHNVDYVLFLDPPEGQRGDLWAELRPMVEQRKGEVVFG